ncbi:putative transaldolase [Gossypium australe]|uniref:Putative transaldolase n=1 Tax=Gossypium australe TaxID=47621 RepID=A0A5B6UDD7_9ROSI|nr:putative transaldolase [Gossypium australe]
MSLSLQSSPSSFLSSSLPKLRLGFANGCSSSSLLFKFNASFPAIRASSGFSSSLDTGLRTELDAVSTFSEIVPDTVIFDDFEKFPPTAATVSSSLLLGILSLPDTIFRNAVDMALADSTCSRLDNPELRLSCFFNKALVNVGGDLAKLVPGRVSTEVDARLAYDTHGIIRRVHDLLKLYNQIDVPPERLLFKIPSTWQGIEASRLLESEGIQTHLTFVYSFAQAAAAAQAGASVIQIFVGRVRDWARNHSGDPEIEAAIQRGEDPGLGLVTKAYNYIHKYGHKSKLMAAAVRNKQDLFSLLGYHMTLNCHHYLFEWKSYKLRIEYRSSFWVLKPVVWFIPFRVDYIIAPLKILQSLKESITAPDEKYSYVRRLSPQSAANHDFTAEEDIAFMVLQYETAHIDMDMASDVDIPFIGPWSPQPHPIFAPSPAICCNFGYELDHLTKWDQLSLASAMGPASMQLLAAGLEGYVNQANRVEELLDKIWPPPNV